MKKAILLIACIMFVFTGAAYAASVNVAVIDTGVHLRPDLIDESRVLTGQNYLTGDANTDDVVGHGTMVASLILGSLDQTINSPSTQSCIVPLVYRTELAAGTVQNGGIEAICKAVYDAVDIYGCRIINLSSGISGPNEELEKAMLYAEEHGVLVVSAAGNSRGEVTYPSAYDMVIGVGSHDSQFRLSRFSSRGQGITLLAPGEALAVASIKNADDYVTVSGTSYATGWVTAQATALCERYPEFTAHELRFLLQTSCLDVYEEGYDLDSGFGCLSPELLADHARRLSAGEELCYFDVGADDWYFDAVKTVGNVGFMKGTEEYRFSPEHTVTRGVFITILHRLAGEPKMTVPGGFADVAPDEWYSSAASWALSQGIVQGAGGELFAPDEPITREQLAVMLYRYAGSPAYNCTKLPFNDTNMVSSYATDAMAWAVENGIIGGVSGNALDPQGNATRAQVATMLMRFVNK